MDFAIVAVIGSWTFGAGLYLGYLYARKQAPTIAHLNDFQKMASRREAVAEFIAPGELAEVVMIADGLHPLCSNLELTREGCQGCRYAGRYLLPKR
jgi:hypothetical protein